MASTTWKTTQQFFEQNAELDDDIPGHNAPTVRGLLRRGYDIVNGHLMVETANGPWPVAPAYAAPAGGEIPHGAEQEVAALRKQLTGGYAQAFQRWAQVALATRDEATAFGRLTTAEKNALSEGLDATGGVTAPPDFSAQIWARAAAQSVVRGRARTVPTVRDRISLSSFAPHSSEPSVYSSDFVATWVPEVPLFNDTDPGLEQFEVSVKKLRVGTRMSTDMARDAAGALGQLIEDGARNLAQAGDQAFIAGTGANHEPMGILNAGITTVDVEGSVANSVANSTSNSGSMPKILSLIASLPEQYRDAARFIMRGAIEEDVRALVDASGLFAFRRPSLDSFPVSLSSAVPDGGTDGSQVIILGDLGGYVVAQRSISISVLPERFADTDRVGIILSERIGGGVHNIDAFRIGVV